MVRMAIGIQMKWHDGIVVAGISVAQYWQPKVQT